MSKKGDRKVLGSARIEVTASRPKASPPGATKRRSTAGTPTAKRPRTDTTTTKRRKGWAIFLWALAGMLILYLIADTFERQPAVDTESGSNQQQAVEPAAGATDAPGPADSDNQQSVTEPTAPEEAEEQGESTLERARQEGNVLVGYSNERPYAFAQRDGSLSGADAEIARAVFEELGIRGMEGVLTQFSSLIPGLQIGRFDVITAGMLITRDHCEQVLFADPEYRVVEALIVTAGNPHNLHSYEDIAANPSVSAGTGAGYPELDYMLAAGVSEDQITTFPDDPSGVAGVQAGQIDAWTGTRPTVVHTLQLTDDPNLQLADPFEQPIVNGEPVLSYGAAAFRFEDRGFRQAVNEELQKLKDSGQLLELIGQFEGFDEAALPGDVHAEDICPDAYSDIP